MLRGEKFVENEYGGGERTWMFGTPMSSSAYNAGAQCKVKFEFKRPEAKGADDDNVNGIKFLIVKFY